MATIKPWPAPRAAILHLSSPLSSGQLRRQLLLSGLQTLAEGREVRTISFRLRKHPIPLLFLLDMVLDHLSEHCDIGVVKLFFRWSGEDFRNQDRLRPVPINRPSAQVAIRIPPTLYPDIADIRADRFEWLARHEILFREALEMTIGRTHRDHSRNHGSSNEGGEGFENMNRGRPARSIDTVSERPLARRNVLTVDIGGSYVKFLAQGETIPRRVKSGKDMQPAGMVETIRAETQDWQYHRVSLGYPGLVGASGPVTEPANLGLSAQPMLPSRMVS